MILVHPAFTSHSFWDEHSSISETKWTQRGELDDCTSKQTIRRREQGPQARKHHVINGHLRRSKWNSVAIVPSLDVLDFTCAVPSVSMISTIASASVSSHGIDACGIHVTLFFRWTLVNVWNQMNITKRARGLHLQILLLNQNNMATTKRSRQNITWLKGTENVENPNCQHQSR